MKKSPYRDFHHRELAAEPRYERKSLTNNGSGVACTPAITNGYTYERTEEKESGTAWSPSLTPLEDKVPEGMRLGRRLPS